MSGTPDNTFDAFPHADGAIDRLLDGGVDDQTRRHLLDHLRADTASREELLARASAVNLLRDPVSAPDFSSEILSQVDRSRPFLPGWARRAVLTGRAAACLTALVGVFAAALFVRANPEVLVFSGEQAALVRVTDAFASDAKETGREARALGQRAQGVLLPISDTSRRQDVFGEGVETPLGSSGQSGTRPQDWSQGIVHAEPAASTGVTPSSGGPVILRPIVAGSESGGPIAGSEPLP